VQLATHTSGLPRLSPWFTAGAADPYAFLTPKVAERELRLTAGRPRGVDWDYPNFGFQVLSLALERAAGVPFSSLLDRHVFQPLGMICSGVARHAWPAIWPPAFRRPTPLPAGRSGWPSSRTMPAIRCGRPGSVGCSARPATSGMTAGRRAFVPCSGSGCLPAEPRLSSSMTDPRGLPMAVRECLGRESGD
jgi:CubicO group peptidase (beta-lactamase class C family)